MELPSLSVDRPMCWRTAERYMERSLIRRTTGTGYLLRQCERIGIVLENHPKRSIPGRISALAWWAWELGLWQHMDGLATTSGTTRSILMWQSSP